MTCQPLFSAPLALTLHCFNNQQKVDRKFSAWILQCGFAVQFCSYILKYSFAMQLCNAEKWAPAWSLFQIQEAFNNLHCPENLDELKAMLQVPLNLSACREPSEWTSDVSTENGNLLPGISGMGRWIPNVNSLSIPMNLIHLPMILTVVPVPHPYPFTCTNGHSGWCELELCCSSRRDMEPGPQVLGDWEIKHRWAVLGC